MKTGWALAVAAVLLLSSGPVGATSGFPSRLIGSGRKAAGKAMRLWADELDGTKDSESRRATVRDAFKNQGRTRTPEQKGG